MSTLTHTAVEITGPEHAPVIVVLGGISSSRHVTATDDNPQPGWWDSFVGYERTIDTGRFRVLGIDYQIASRNRQPFTARDQASVLLDALDAENITSVRAIVGASYGGMVALAFGALAPERAENLIVIGAAHESAPLTTAIRIIQRRIVELGLKTGTGHDALVIARSLAMTTYSTQEDFSERFASDGNDADATRQLVEEFLLLQGETYARSCSPERFLALSQSLDLHQVRPEDVQVPTTLIAVEEDSLVPIGQVRDLAARLGARCRLVELRSPYGHDTFLNDPDLLAPHVRRALSSLTLQYS